MTGIYLIRGQQWIGGRIETRPAQKTPIRPPVSVSKKDGFASFRKVRSSEEQGSRAAWRSGCAGMNPEVFEP
jgi:hypothetical protein